MAIQPTPPIQLDKPKRKPSSLPPYTRTPEFRARISKQFKGMGTGIKRGPMSEEVKDILRKARYERKAKLGYLNSPEARKKLSEAKMGAGSSSWRGGVTPFRELLRNSSKYFQWRFEVFSRDNFTCVSCGDKATGKLQADHIYPLACILEDYQIRDSSAAYDCEALWDINNGRTLCQPCHKLTDTYGAKGKKLLDRKRALNGYTADTADTVRP